ncbi:MAG: hypothetical protein ACI9W2_000713 [Gammaproteobacteria bacterium]|jgi:hypothetical protein
MLTYILRIIGRLLGIIVCLALGPATTLVSGDATLAGDWRRASHERTGIAPAPTFVREALVQVYGARAFRWRGAFGIHTWIATKAADAPTYTIYQVIGWRAYGGGNAVSVHRGYPDHEWYGAKPVLLGELRGAQAQAAISTIAARAASYPHAYNYRIWPGPNSNTFVAYITRGLPALNVDLPPTAIGKDYVVGESFPGSLWQPTPSGQGLQVSLAGLAGFLVSKEEGLEMNFLGLGFGIDPGDRALRLPGIGQLRLTGVGEAPGR